MPIATENGQLAALNFGGQWGAPLPLSPGALGQDDQQQLLWGFPEILWEEEEEEVSGLVCGVLSVAPLVNGTLSVTPLVNGTLAIEGC